MRYLGNDERGVSVVGGHSSVWSLLGRQARALRVSSGRDGPSFDLDPDSVGGLFVFDNRRAQMELSPHATWECGTHSTTVQTCI